LQVTANIAATVPMITTDRSPRLCEGDSITLTSSPAGSYLWSNNATSQSITVAQAGDYFVKIADGNNCAATSHITTVMVNLAPKAIINTNGPVAFCEGGSVTLTANPASSYLWSNNETSQSIIVDATGVNTVIITDVNGCSSIPSAPVIVNVKDLPTTPEITVNGNTLSSNVPFGNQWYLNGNIIPGAISRTYVVKDNGDYTVIVSNGSCSATSPVYSFTTLAVNGIVKDIKLNIFPNPNNGRFTIKLDAGVKSVRIFNAIGELVYESGNIDSEIDLTGRAYGVYSIQVIANEGTYKGSVIIQ
jgi:hypothetical protein